jgi:hypothetical protein
MMFHPYAPWFGWYAPPMQYESFYPRSVKHEPNAFDSSSHLRKDCFYLKSVECSENQGTTKLDTPVLKSRGSIFPSSSWPHRTKKVYRAKQNANSNDGSNLDAQDEKPMFANDKK